MNRLKDYEKVIYDSNIIIYYCFKTKETKIIELTDKTHILTEFLVKNQSKITVPNFIIDEIMNMDIPQMISEMIKSGKLTNMPKYTDYSFQFTLSLKLQKKFRKMQEKDWFLIEVYFPTKNLYKQIEDFFKGLEYHPLIKEFLRLKQKTSPIPSFEDIGLIAYSKQKGHPIITNDRDITFFCEELVKNKLS